MNDVVIFDYNCYLYAVGDDLFDLSGDEAGYGGVDVVVEVVY